MSYEFLCESAESNEWYCKNNFTMYIKSARLYTEKEAKEATKNTMLNSFTIFK